MLPGPQPALTVPDAQPLADTVPAQGKLACGLLDASYHVPGQVDVAA